MTDLVSLQEVYKAYGPQLALSDITLTLTAGKIIGLLGPNGSGKSSLLKLLAGLLQPDSGQVLIHGLKPSVTTKTMVSYLPAQSYLRDQMTVQSILTFFSEFYQDFNQDKAKALLADLGIDLLTQLKNLSAGNKEKVQLVLVMSRQAKLYLLDEPLAGIDPAARSHIIKTILKTANPDSTVVISTQLISDCEPIFDDVIFLNQGQVQLLGNADDLRSQYGLSIDALFRQTFQV